MESIKTMNDFKIPQFTFISIPEQDEFVRQKEAEAERERQLELLAKKETGVRKQRSSETLLE